MNNILICTVGGSYQPIISAIDALKPDFVVFICSDKDPATGRPGSNSQIVGKGSCIKAHPQDEKPTLPAIPKQAGLAEAQYEVVCTVADDLDRVFLDCSLAIEKITQNIPDAKIFADYTGGTKSMSAGLVMAALDNPDIELQLVTGSRSDLIKVHDGSQYTALANIEQIRFQRMLSPFKQCWQRYAYSEAEAGLKQICTPRDNQLRSSLNRFRDISHAFAEWDNFNHKDALEILRRYAPNLPAALKQYIAPGMRLNDNNPKKQDAARLFDLYLNAQRRAHQGRYDDAIARIYRLIEWSAQWLLQHLCNIYTSNIQGSDIPLTVQISQNREGQRQAGLYAAWQLVKYKTSGAAAEFIAKQEKVLLNHIKVRNQSILAHGFSPITQVQWQAVDEFMADEFIPMLLQETACIGIKQLPVQLPDQY
jgi:CRISPR-associated protein (TIGR02710 family)